MSLAQNMIHTVEGDGQPANLLPNKSPPPAHGAGPTRRRNMSRARCLIYESSCGIISNRESIAQNMKYIPVEEDEQQANLLPNMSFLSGSMLY